jgi:hypothetical protein
MVRLAGHRLTATTRASWPRSTAARGERPGTRLVTRFLPRPSRSEGGATRGRRRVLGRAAPAAGLHRRQLPRRRDTGRANRRSMTAGTPRSRTRQQTSSSDRPCGNARTNHPPAAARGRLGDAACDSGACGSGPACACEPALSAAGRPGLPVAATTVTVALKFAHLLARKPLPRAAAGPRAASEPVRVCHPLTEAPCERRPRPPAKTFLQAPRSDPFDFRHEVLCERSRVVVACIATTDRPRLRDPRAVARPDTREVAEVDRHGSCRRVCRHDPHRAA